MTNGNQIPPILLTRALGLWLSGRIHFPRNRIGELIQEDEEEFRIFRQVIVDPTGAQPESSSAIFKVCFRYKKFSANTNRRLSLIPIPFIIAQPGFISKTWLLGQESGISQGFYEWDTVKDAENYWSSFPMSLLKKRVIPGSISYNIIEKHPTGLSTLKQQQYF